MIHKTSREKWSNSDGTEPDMSFYRNANGLSGDSKCGYSFKEYSEWWSMPCTYTEKSYICQKGSYTNLFERVIKVAYK
jgi:hypothetical protein